MSKIGICFGGYCPMHRGHLDAIMKAKKENDKVFVIVCGYDNEERAGNINMTLKERTAVVRKIFKNDEIITVMSINDTELGIDESMSVSNWCRWQNKVGELLYDSMKFSTVQLDEITWYVRFPCGIFLQSDDVSRLDNWLKRFVGVDAHKVEVSSHWKRHQHLVSCRGLPVAAFLRLASSNMLWKC